MMHPVTPVWLSIVDARGVWHAIPAVVTVDHGPIFEYRYLTVAAGYEEFPSGQVLRSPAGQYVTWASDEMIAERRQEAA
jgi:hypothetical protein